MSSDTPSISIGSISGGQNNIGKTEIAGDQVQTNNFAGAVPSVEEVFQKITESLPTEAESDIKEAVVEPLQAMACMPIAQMESQEVKAKAEPLIQRLIPYAPGLAQGFATFGAAALKALANRNWIVAGILAVCEANKAESAIA